MPSNASTNDDAPRRQTPEVARCWEAGSADSPGDVAQPLDEALLRPIESTSDRPATARHGRQLDLAVGSLVLACLSWMLGPFAAIPAVILGHAARSNRRDENQQPGDRIVVVSLIVGYSFLAATVLTVQLLLVQRIFAIVIFDDVTEPLLAFWCFAYAFLIAVSWLYTLARRPRLGKNLTFALIAGVMLCSLLIWGLQQAREEARNTLLMDRLRQLGVFRQEFEDTHGTRD